MPRDGTAVRVQVSKATAVVIGAPGGDAAPPPQPADELDLLSYGSPAPLLRPGAGHPPVRVPDRSPTRLRQRIARYVVVDQRTPFRTFRCM